MMDQIRALEKRTFQADKMLQEHGKELKDRVGESKYL
jgi:hypothetical protein